MRKGPLDVFLDEETHYLIYKAQKIIEKRGGFIPIEADIIKSAVKEYVKRIEAGK